MDLENLPFKIGMQYENWEFDLELEDTKRSYEVYRYIKNDIKEINGVDIDKVLLYFELDILIRIKICFKHKPINLLINQKGISKI